MITAMERLRIARSHLAAAEDNFKKEAFVIIDEQIAILKNMGIKCVFYECTTKNAARVYPYKARTISQKQKKRITSPEHLEKLNEGRKRYYERMKQAKINSI